MRFSAVSESVSLGDQFPVGESKSLAVYLQGLMEDGEKTENCFTLVNTVL